MSYNPNRDPAEERRFAAAYLAKHDELRQQSKGMESGEFVRTLIVAVVIWVGLIVVTQGHSVAVMGGWLVGFLGATLLPFIGRWLTGGPWRDPREVRIAAERGERQRSMESRGRYATDVELMKQARERAAREGRSFPGSETTPPS